MRAKTVSLVLAVVVVSVVARYWELVPMLIQSPFSVLGLVILGYLTLAAASVAGLVLARRWGLHAFGALVVYSTAMLSLSLVPLPRLVSPAWLELIAVNGLVLVGAVLAGGWTRQQPATASPALPRPE